MIDRTYHSLVAMLKSIEGQLSAKDSELTVNRNALLARGDRTKWYAEQARHERWRAGAVRVKVGLEETLAGVRLIRDEMRQGQYESFRKDERLALANRVEELEAAIRKHRDTVGGSDEADRELWSVLDGRSRT